ncbi:hypothetical protein PG988_002346 [Apiospora saccharicola]
MAANDIDIRSLERIKEVDHRLSDQEWAILGILESAIRSPTPETLADAAKQIDVKCPPPQERDEILNYVTNVYEMVVAIASSPSVSGEVQGYLVDIIKALEQRSKGTVLFYHSRQRLWEDSPLLGMAIDDEYNGMVCLPSKSTCSSADKTSTDPLNMYFTEKEKYPPEELKAWQAANSFLARLTAAEVYGPSHQVMHAMQSALEQELSTFTHPGMKECRVLVAADWMQRCAGQMLSWAQENIGVTDVPESDTEIYFENGRLYKGPSAMCLQRWGFWIDRFGVIGKSDSGLSEETRKAALEAMEIMNTVERSVGHTLASAASEEPSEETSIEASEEPLPSQEPSQDTDISDELEEEEPCEWRPAPGRTGRIAVSSDYPEDYESDEPKVVRCSVCGF